MNTVSLRSHKETISRNMSFFIERSDKNANVIFPIAVVLPLVPLG